MNYMLHKNLNNNLIEQFIIFGLDTQSGKRVAKAFSYVLEKLCLIPNLSRVLEEIKIVVLDEYPSVRIVINQCTSSSVMSYGYLDDLDDVALVGLTVHLISLIYKGYDKNFPSRGEDKLKNDLLADDMAQEWGFDKEMRKFRQIRPYGKPIDFQYPTCILNCSLANKELYDAVNDDKYKRLFNLSKIIYTEKFSLVSNISDFSSQGIKYLIVANNTAKDPIVNVLTNIEESVHNVKI